MSDSLNPNHLFLRSRRSVRNFLSVPVPDNIIERILETSIFAPSAHNRQPWRFVIVKTSETRCRLANDMASDFRKALMSDGLTEEVISARIEKSRSRITEAPVVIILCTDNSEMDRYPDENRSEAERTMAIQSTALAGLQLMLAAHAEGLGCVWTCGPLFAQETVRKSLDLPSYWDPQALILLGYIKENPPLVERKPIGEVTITC